MPIRVIVDWKVSIRPCEFKNFTKLFNKYGFIPSKAEQQNLAEYLTETGISLSEIVMFSDKDYQEIHDRIVPQTNTQHFFDILNMCRLLINEKAPGSNVLCYLLYHMTNRIIKEHYKEHWKWNYQECKYEYIGGNFKLSNLYLAYECIPFDTMPFCSGLRHHVPSISDLFDCLDTTGREHEILAWTIKIIQNRREFFLHH